MPRRIEPVRLDGLTEAKEAIAALPELFAGVAAETLDTGSAIIESEAHGRVAIDEGDLDRSIGRNIRGDGLEVAVGAGDFKAAWVEFGTSDTPAQPWLYPSFRLGVKFIRKQMREWAGM